MKKSPIIIFCMILAILLVPVYCSAYSTSYSFNTGSGGRAYLSGRDNGIYYSFTKGKNASLNLRNTEGSGNLYITLYRDNSLIGLGTMVGSKTWSTSPGTSKSFSFGIDKTYGKYYLFFKGSGSYATYSGEGTFSQ